MITQKQLMRLIGKPVGITFKDGTGVSGVLCSVDKNSIKVIVFQIGKFFALNTFKLSKIRRVRKFPKCP